jgi:exosortase
MTSRTWTAEKGLVATALLLLLLAVYARTLAGFVDGWHDEENMHGWLVAPLAAFLVWMNWPRLQRTPVRGNPAAGLTVLGVALLVQVVGVWLGLNRSVGYSFVFALTGLCLYFLGTEMTKVLAFPLAFLLFMVPTPGGVIDQISSPLQRLSASAVQVVSGFAGVNVRAEGVSLYLPDKNPPITLQVAEGCSGLHSLTAMAMLAAILAYFMAVPTRWKWGLFALALPVAMFGNIVRIFAVVMVASAHGQAAGIAFHDSTVGKMLPFLTAFLIVMGLGKLIELKMARKAEPPAPPPADAPEDTSGTPGQTLPAVMIR